MKNEDFPMQRKPSFFFKFHHLDRLLLLDEYVVYIARLHWAIHLPGLLTIFFGVFIGALNAFLAQSMLGEEIAAMIRMPVDIFALAFIALGFFHMFFTFIRDISNLLVLTNQRVISKRGFLSAKIQDVLITKLSSIEITQSAWARLMDYGTIEVEASGNRIRNLDHIVDPYRFYYYTMSLNRQAIRLNAGESEALPQEISPEKHKLLR